MFWDFLIELFIACLPGARREEGHDWLKTIFVALLALLGFFALLGGFIYLLVIVFVQ